MNTFHIATGVIATDDEENILMVKEGKQHVKGSWDFPGGNLEQDETIQECAERELLEETGYKTDIKDLIGIYLEKSQRTGKTVAVFVFKADIKDKTQKTQANEEILDQKFFPPEEIPSLNLRKQNRKKMLEDFRNGKTMSKDRIVDTI